MKNSIYFILGLSLIALSLVVVKSGVSNSFSDSGVELTEINRKITELRTKNTVMKEKYLAISSLSNVASEAGKLGFVDSKSYFSLNSPLPLARR